MQALLQQLPQENRSIPRQLVGAGVTRAGISAQLTAFGIRPSDTIFCYYAGVANYTAAGVQQFLPQAPAPALLRTTLLTDLIGTGARLTVLVSDANSGQVIPAQTNLQVGNPATTPALGTPAITGTNAFLVNLLLGFAGVVDVNGASPGQDAWFSNGGGWFTSQFTKVATSPPADNTWPTFLQKVQDETDSFFGTQRKDLVFSGTPANKTALATQTKQNPIVVPLNLTQSLQCVPMSNSPIPLTPDAINAMHRDGPLPTLVCANGKALPDAPPPVIVVERNSPQRLALSPLASSPVFVSANKGESSARLPVIVNVRNAAIATPKEVSWRPGIEPETLAQK